MLGIYLGHQQKLNLKDKDKKVGDPGGRILQMLCSMSKQDI